jgi:predicted phage tail protein
MSQSKKITEFKGAGGGGKSGTPASPTRTPDNLRSEDTVEAILAICEGPVYGLARGAKSFYIGDTVLENDDGTKNFEYFDLGERPGLPEGQATVINHRLGGDTTNHSVGVQLSYNVPVTRQMPDKGIDALDIRLGVAQLYRTDDSGVFEHTLKIKIEIKKSTESSWSFPFAQSILELNGKTTSTYVKEIRIPVERSQDYYWMIRITKLSPQSTTTEIADVAWESVQSVFQATKTYPNTATLQIIGKATNQFSSIPTFSSIFKGLLISVPTNYNATTRTYSGVWDGTFKKAYSNNPAWCLYDFLLNDRYGMSSTSPVSVDKYEFYDAGQWCDQLVPDGAGGTEPRYTLNTLIQEPRSAIEQARFLAGMMNGTVYDNGNGTIVLRVDRNDAATHLFTPENISSEGFQYSFTDMTQRYNDIIVSFVNPLTNWDEDRRRVFDQDSIDTFGRVPYDFVAIGCTKESEALRRAYYKMNTALTETMLVSFKTNRLGLAVQPFDVILISDPDLGYSVSGRIKSLDVGRTTVTLRDSLYLETGIPYKGYFRTPDGVIERTITTASSGAVTAFNVSPALPANTPDLCTFSIEQAAGVGLGAPKPFRVLRISEGDSPDTVEITGHEVNRNKYADSEAQVVSTPTDYSGMGDPANIPGPTDVQFKEIYSKSDNKVWTVVTPTFPSTYRYYSGDFEVYSRPVIGGTPSGSFVQRTLFYGDTLIGHPTGPHEVKIVPRNTFGQIPPVALVATWSHNFASVDEIGIPPTPVNSVEVIPTRTGFYLKWLMNPDQQDYVHHFVIREGATFETSTILADNIREFFYLIDPMGKRTYNLYISAVSISFVESDPVAVSFTNSQPAPPTNLTVNVAYETIMVFFDRMTEVDIVGYRLQYRKVGDAEYLDMDPSGLFDTGEPNTAYEFRVAAQDPLTQILHDEIWSNPISARTRNTLSVEKGFDDVYAATTTNLVKNGSFEKDFNYWHVDQTRASVQTDLAAPYADPLNATSKVLKLGDGTTSTVEIYSDRFVVRPLMPYTASMDLRKDADAGENHYFTLRVFDQNSALIKEFQQVEGKLLIDPEELDLTAWARFKSTFEMPALAVWAEVVIVSNGAGILWVDGVQVQKGSVATSFNPHVVEEISAKDLGLISDPDQTPPSVVTGVTVSAAFKNITLTWTAPGDKDVAKYEILRAIVNNVSSATLVGSSIGTVFSDGNVSTGVSYYYWIRAVDSSGNKSATAPGNTSGARGITTPLAAADFQTLSIVGAMIAEATIDDAKIATLSASKLQAGTISAGDIFVGNDRLRIEGSQTRFRVLDDFGVERVRLGRLDVGAQNYGIEVRDASGKLVLGATGLGLNVVGAGQLLNQSVDGTKISLSAINADHIASASITASKLQASSVTANAIAVGAVTADKITVATLSAIAANLGTVTAGKLQGAGLAAATNFWNLDTGEFRIGTPDQSQYIRYDPLLQKIFIKGQVEFQSTDVDWTSIRNRPLNLASLDPDSATKLGTVAVGADKTADNVAKDVTNLYGIPAVNIAYWAANPAVMINIQSTTINGAKITTGTITANQLNVATLSSISANIGAITAGLISNTSKTAVINLAASGSGNFIDCNGKFKVTADGAVSMTSGSISGDLIVNGTLIADKIANNQISQAYSGDNSVGISGVQPEESFLVFGYLTGVPPSGKSSQVIITPSPGTTGTNMALSGTESHRVRNIYAYAPANPVFGSIAMISGTSFAGIITGVSGNLTFRAYIEANPNGLTWHSFGSSAAGSMKCRIVIIRLKK